MTASRTHNVINITDTPVSFEFADGDNQLVKHSLAPGELVAIPTYYAVAVKVGHGDPRKSVIENLTGGKVLAFDDPRAASAFAAATKADAKLVDTKPVAKAK
jgi:hypothetical protein